MTILLFAFLWFFFLQIFGWVDKNKPKCKINRPQINFMAWKKANLKTVTSKYQQLDLEKQKNAASRCNS